MNKNLEQNRVKTRQKVYEFLVEFITKHGYSPSIREICGGVNLKSTASVYDHLQILERLGKIHMEGNKPRTISLVGYEYIKVK